MATRYPRRFVAEIEDVIAEALAVEADLRALQEAAPDPTLVRYLEEDIRAQRRVLAFLTELRREMDRG
jgi:hypothetical protein